MSGRAIGLLLLVCLFGCSYAFRAEVRDPKKVKVSIYYESHCVSSRNFIEKQLWPHWKDLEEGINLDLVPFGKANYSVVEDHLEFSCEHGAEECRTNKLHACVIKKMHAHPTKMLKVIKCLMTQKDQIEGLPDCLTEVSMRAETQRLLDCTDSPDADLMLALYGERTQKKFKKLEATPKILFNDTYKKKEQTKSLKEFAKTVCAYIPLLCKDKIKLVPQLLEIST